MQPEDVGLSSGLEQHPVAAIEEPQDRANPALTPEDALIRATGRNRSRSRSLSRSRSHSRLATRRRNRSRRAR